MPLGSLYKTICSASLLSRNLQRYYYGIPFYDLYQYTTGQPLTEYMLNKLRAKHPALDTLNREQLHWSLQILNKFGVDPLEACANPHVFCMNPISLDNYGEILRECRFAYIAPKHLIRYHTLVRSRTIAHHKKEGLIRDDIHLEDVLLNCFEEWPSNRKIKHGFNDSTTSILTVRLSVLESYLTWKLSITPEEFKKYCKNYLPLKHKPMSDIQQALHIAENDMNLDLQIIRRNGFIISADPIHTQLILENVKSLAGLDIREAIRMEPGILKNNYNALLEIRNILQEYGIGQEVQQRSLRVFCMRPETVRERLEDLKNQKEYNILSSHPRMLSMVIHKRKMMTRINKIEASKKQCFSLNRLVSSSKVFNEYISSFGDKTCGRDIAVLVVYSLEDNNGMTRRSESLKFVLSQLKRHKFWLHAALNIVDENIKFLQQRFHNRIIINNCQLLLYPITDIEKYVEEFLVLRRGARGNGNITLEGLYNNLKCEELTDDQILSLALYEIEKRYHFSGDGIWARQRGVKIGKAVS